MKNFKNTIMIFLAILCFPKSDLNASTQEFLDDLPQESSMEIKHHFSLLSRDQVSYIAEFLNIQEMRQIFSTSKSVCKMFLEIPHFEIDRRWKIEHIREKLPILSKLSPSLKERFSTYLSKNFLFEEHPEFLDTFLNQSLSIKEMSCFKKWICSDFKIYSKVYQKAKKIDSFAVRHSELFCTDPAIPISPTKALIDLRKRVDSYNFSDCATECIAWEHILRSLYERGECSEIIPNDLKRALKCAIYANNFSFMNFLILQGAYIHDLSLIALLKEGNIKEAMLLLENGLFFDNDDRELVKLIIKSGNVDILKFFVDKGLVLGNQVFKEAIDLKNKNAKSMIKFLIKEGLSFETVFHSINALSTIPEDILEILTTQDLVTLRDFSLVLEQNPSISFLKMMIEKMIDSGLDINGSFDVRRELSGCPRRTLFPMVLEKRNHQELAHFLIEKGIAVPNDGNLIYQAIENNDLKTTKFLIDYKHKQRHDKYFPIHCACENDNLDIIKLLIEEKTDFARSTSYGQSILHIAASKGNLEIVEFLLGTQKKLSWKDKDGFTPLDLARNNSRADVVRFLEDKG